MIKNVAGYDLTKFMVGSHGVFGTPVTITVRTYRRPMGAIIVRQDFQAGVVGASCRRRFGRTGHIVRGSEILLGFLGDASHIDFYERKVLELFPLEKRRRAVDEDIADREKLWRAKERSCFRASVPPASIGVFVEQAKLEQWVADAAFGVVMGGVSESAREKVVIAAEASGGLDSSVAQGRSRNEPINLLHLSTNEGERQIIERLKEAFDPQRRLPSLPWLKP